MNYKIKIYLEVIFFVLSSAWISGVSIYHFYLLDQRVVAIGTFAAVIFIGIYLRIVFIQANETIDYWKKQAEGKDNG